MPKIYGQVKGRKYPSDQPLINDNRKPRKKRSESMRTCAKCGDKLPVRMYKHRFFCPKCQEKIASKNG